MVAMSANYTVANERQNNHNSPIAHTKEQQHYLRCKLIHEEQDRDFYATLEPKFS